MTRAQAAWEPPAEPEAARAIEPWLLLPSQLAVGDRTTALSGERRLMAAILGDAIQVYLKYRSCGATRGRLFRDAEQWIESRGCRGLFSFESVCDALNVDAERVRAVLRTHVGSHGRHGIPVDACRLRVARGRKMRL